MADGSAGVAPPSVPEMTERQKWRVVFVLSAALGVSFLDRTIVNLLLEPIKHSFNLNDTQLGMLSGLAFAAFYSTSVVLFGVLADRVNRRMLILAGILSWSALTALSGLSRSFGQLVLCRSGLAIGEATLSPASYSLISEMFGSRFGRPISVFFAGSMLGPALALLYGALLYQLFTAWMPLSLPFYGPVEVWQCILIAASIPGFAVAVAIWCWVREPRTLRPASSHGRQSGFAQLWQGLIVLWRGRAVYGPLIGSVTLVSIHTNGFLAWSPTFLSRSYGWNTSDIGLWLGLIMLFAGVGGSFFGGWCSDRLPRPAAPDAILRISMWMFLLSLPASLLTCLALAPWLALLMIAAYVFCCMAAMAAAPTALMALTPPEFRGQMSSIYLLIIGIFAIATGATLVGISNDLLTGGNVGISLALLSVCTIPPAVLILALRGRTARRA